MTFGIWALKPVLVVMPFVSQSTVCFVAMRVALGKLIGPGRIREPVQSYLYQVLSLDA